MTTWLRVSCRSREEELARLSQASEPEDPYPYRFLNLYGSRDPNPIV